MNESTPAAERSGELQPQAKAPANGRGARRIAGLLVRLSLLVVLVGTTGCIQVIQALLDLALCDRASDGTPRSALGVCGLPPGAKAQGAVAPRSDELSFHAGALDTRPNGRRIPVPVELVPPFRVETTLGLCDPAFAPDAAASFGAAIGEDLAGAGWWSVSCRVADGLVVSPEFGSGADKALPGARKVALAFEHDGTDLVAYVRSPAAAGTWEELARTAASAAGGTFVLEFWAQDFQAGAMSSVYDLRIVQNADAPAGVPPQRAAAREIAEAATPLLAAIDALQAEASDAAGAADLIDDARSRIAGALASLDAAAIAPAKPTPAQAALRKARTSLTRASNRLNGAAKLLRKKGSRKAAAAAKSAGKSIRDLVAALDLVLPDDLRAAAGGIRLADVLAK